MVSTCLSFWHEKLGWQDLTSKSVTWSNVFHNVMVYLEKYWDTDWRQSTLRKKWSNSHFLETESILPVVAHKAKKNHQGDRMARPVMFLGRKLSNFLWSVGRSGLLSPREVKHQTIKRWFFDCRQSEKIDLLVLRFSISTCNKSCPTRDIRSLPSWSITLRWEDNILDGTLFDLRNTRNIPRDYQSHNFQRHTR